MRLDSSFHQTLHSKLSRFGFLFAQDCGFDDVCQCDKASAAIALFEGEFAQGFDIKTIFIIASGSAHFDEDDIDLFAAWTLHRKFAQFHLDHARDMRNHLHIASEISAASFALKDFCVNLTSGHKITSRQILSKYSFVCPQIHVGLESIIEYEDFSMSIWIESSRINVEISLQLHRSNRETFVLKKLRQGTCKDSFSKPAHYGADHNDESSSAFDISRWRW